MRILLIEDNLRLATLVRKGMEKEGLTVDAFGTIAEGETAISITTYDAIILDLGLPDGDGMDFIKHMQEQKISAPVIILTARDGIDDRVKGLNAGADDYLLKPFAMEELTARVRALLRRPDSGMSVNLTAGNVIFDTAAREVRVNDEVIKISPREMGALEQLMRRAGRVVAKDTLESKLYGFGDEVTANSVEVNISRLRKRLTQVEASVNIHTLRGVGYLLSEQEEV